MSYHTPELSAPEVLPHAQELLEEKLPLKAEGYKCTTDDLFKVWVGIAATKSTVEAVCAELGGTPDPQTIRGYFNEHLRVEELPALEPQLNAALAAEVPPHVRRQSQEVAIDYHDRPYYGKGEQAPELWGRSKAKDGTTRFYRVATAYLILNGLRVTWALHFGERGGPLAHPRPRARDTDQLAGARQGLREHRDDGLFDPPGPSGADRLPDSGHHWRHPGLVSGPQEFRDRAHVQGQARAGVYRDRARLPGVYHGPADRTLTPPGGGAVVPGDWANALAPLCAPRVWASVWHRNQLSLRGAGARLDHGQKSGLSLRVAGAGLCIAPWVDSVALALHAGAAPGRTVVRYSPLPPAALCHVSPAGVRGVVWLCPGHLSFSTTARGQKLNLLSLQFTYRFSLYQPSRICGLIEKL
jgi:hypothetical protein